MILNVTLNVVPTCHMLPQPCSNHSQLCKFLVLEHFKHPWAVSQPRVCRAIGSVLTATAGRRDKCFKFPRAQKETLTGVKFLVAADFLRVADCMHISPVPASRNFSYSKKGNLELSVLTSPWRQWHVTWSASSVGSVALMISFFFFCTVGYHKSLYPPQKCNESNFSIKWLGNHNLYSQIFA